MTRAAASRHLTEEDFVLHYYGEADKAPDIDDHLAACEACRDEFTRLRDVLALVDAQEVPDPGPAFERDVWLRLAPHLTSRRESWLQRLWPTPSWAYAGGLAALLLAAFVAGRMSRPMPPDRTAIETDRAPTDRVFVIAVGDHLDRSQMVLVELLNADLDAPRLNLDAEQARARDLVAANRLYRQSAVHVGDERTGEVLDELERVLIEIANAPEDANKDEFEAVRARIATHGLLFKVRVVHSEMRERERRTQAGSPS